MEIFIQEETIPSAMGKRHFVGMDRRISARETVPAALDAAGTAVRAATPIAHARARGEQPERQEPREPMEPKERQEPREPQEPAVVPVSPEES